MNKKLLLVFILAGLVILFILITDSFIKNKKNDLMVKPKSLPQPAIGIDSEDKSGLNKQVQDNLEEEIKDTTEDGLFLM